MKILIRSEVVVEREIEMTAEEYRRAYHADFGECRKWLSRKQEVKIHDKMDAYANHALEMKTQVFVQDAEENGGMSNEHSEDQSL